MPDPAPPLASPLSLTTAASSVRGRRILVVEDDCFLAQDVRRELLGMGATVMGPVPSVARALALLAAGGPPDAAILDVNLGGEMAYPVADALLSRAVPFAFVTGYDASAIPQAYAQVPRCEKPFDVGRSLRTLLAR